MIQKDIARFFLCLIIAILLCRTVPPAVAAETTSPPAAADRNDAYADFLNEAEEETAVQVADPLYYWNKAMFHVNDKLYFWVLKPVATGYKAVVPGLARTGVRNFFHNLATPVRFVNSLLQGKSEQAGVELGRFMVNTTMGVLGFGDPAQKEPDLKRPPAEDLGQTLGLYGLGNGCYLVWPVLGPSTLRDSVGMFGDQYLSPLSSVNEDTVRFGATGLKIVNALSFRLGEYETLKEAALEPYESLRNAFIQNRAKQIRE
ncbi:VacJ family lipoprotein [Desulfonema ishimotonii]|uniref:VacJ family lipoprotein n=1 Tax=Desulfonema ishimotonii TaxID=45657 RepID=A0A401G071_9BACT|nr:VacJ family lipoprotein [Desulfonema ishimotonii]GBC62586.1 VacJ family lipoprotein [Desulfonema ishimotonii]